MDAMLPLLRSPKEVLMLGAGFVTRPALEILSSEGIQVTVACRTIESAQDLCKGIRNACPIRLDVNDANALDAAMTKVSLVLSLIPYTYHVLVIKSAIRQKKHVVTTSYISPAMMELDQEAKEAGITVLNEIGLDPGIDHLWAVKKIEEVHQAGGKITAFLSYCGGLPAPEDSDNPLGYKFSWSARGVLLAARNSAKFYQDNKTVEVSPNELMSSAKPYLIYPGYAFVAYANRDSTPYRVRYSIPEAETIIRGTLRYQGCPQFIKVLADVGFLSDVEEDYLKPGSSLTWKETTARILRSASDREDDLVWAISSKTQFPDTDEKKRIIAGLRWLGIFSDEKISPRGTPLDTLSATMETRMVYSEGERDMVVLQHLFKVETHDGSRETHTSTLVDYGDPKGYSAMAKLVGTPAAVAVLKVLDGTISQRGIIAPLNSEINNPIMEELKTKYRIDMKEKILA